MIFSFHSLVVFVGSVGVPMASEVGFFLFRSIMRRCLYVVSSRTFKIISCFKVFIFVCFPVRALNIIFLKCVSHSPSGSLVFSILIILICSLGSSGECAVSALSFSPLWLKLLPVCKIKLWTHYNKLKKAMISSRQMLSVCFTPKSRNWFWWSLVQR